jgi:ribosomal-protein-alanine N-acetyltransferase
MQPALSDLELAPRRVRDSDLAALMELEQKLYSDMSYPFFVFRQMLETQGSHFFVVPGRDGAIIAYALAATSKESQTAWLLSVGVRADWRSRGIGRRITQHAVDSLKESGVKKILLSVEPDNVTAINLYKTLSFSALRTATDYFGPTEDRLIMEAAL